MLESIWENRVRENKRSPDETLFVSSGVAFLHAMVFRHCEELFLRRSNPGFDFLVCMVRVKAWIASSQKALLAMTAKEVILLLCLFSSPSYAGGIYGTTLCKEEGFHCVRVKGNQSWRSLWPDEHDRDIVMRVNRMNTQLYPGLRIAVPDNLAEADIMDFAPFEAKTDTKNEKLVIVDPISRAWGAYDETGSLVRWGPASAGSDWCRDLDEPCHTRPGSYRVFTLGSSSCYSTKFPLPDGGAHALLHVFQQWPSFTWRTQWLAWL